MEWMNRTPPPRTPPPEGRGRKNGRSIIVASVIVLAWFAFPTAVRAGDADNITGWAWGAEVGWISMNATNCEALNRAGEPDPCALGGTDYGVTIARNGAVSGFAWSRTAGWICVGSSCGSLGPEWGSVAPSGGWRARVNAITGEVSGWAKAVALKDGGWISFSCENTSSCGNAAYRTTVNVATGAFAGHAWSSSSDGHGLGWISWAPAFGGVMTTWRPEPLCSVSGEACRSDIECGLPGEFCCLGGAACGRCDGAGAACGRNADCAAGVLCCREGQQCGQCVQNGAACGADADCPNQARDSCCPPGALCAGGGGVGGGSACNNNGTCGPGETSGNCPLDCGAAEVRGSTCDGDGVCEAGEAVTNCASDCGAGGGGGGTCNNNGVCEAGESLVDCVVDCGGATQTPIIGACRSDAFPPTPTLCVDDAQCGGVRDACRVADVGICSSSITVCGGPTDCSGDGNACEVDIGIRTDPEFLRAEPTEDIPEGRTGRSVPCTTDDPNCRKVIGKCTGAEQLCAVDGNCPRGSACGKLFLPWVQTRLGSIYSGGSVGSSRTAPPPSGQYNATYCILAGGPIVNFLSAPDPAGCRGIRRTPYPRAGARFSLPKFPNYVGSIARIDVDGILRGRYGTPVTQFPSTDELAGGSGILGGRIFRWTGDANPRLGKVGRKLVFQNATGRDVRGVPVSGAGLFIIRGQDLFIDSSMEYGGGAVDNVRNLASPGFLVLKDRVRDASGNLVEVGGNIIIDPTVTALVGAFYAEGEIRTGSTGRAAHDKPLVVNGVMVARKFIFERLYAGAAAAEQIIADGRVVANPPPGFGDLARSLPTITQSAP